MATRRALAKERAQLVGAADTPFAAALPAVALTDRQPNPGGKGAGRGGRPAARLPGRPRPEHGDRSCCGACTHNAESAAVMMTDEQVRNILLMHHDSLKNDPLCPLLPNHEISQTRDSRAPLA